MDDEAQVSPVASAGDALLSPITGNGPLSATLHYLLSLIAGDDPLSTVFIGFSSLVVISGPLFVVSGCLLSAVVDGGLLSTVSGCFLSYVASGSLLSAISGSGHLFTIFGSSLLSPLLSADFRALFLTSTPSRIYCSSLPSSLLFYSSLPFLPTLLARNPTLFTEKQLFDQAFITQRPIASIWQQEEVDLSSRQCLYSTFIKINRL